MSHKVYIGLIESLGLKFTPKLKAPIVKMPYQGDYSADD
jgi:glycerophosphoryl diester phosphodiesterase